jgi:hypothetical protein
MFRLNHVWRGRWHHRRRAGHARIQEVGTSALAPSKAY